MFETNLRRIAVLIAVAVPLSIGVRYYESRYPGNVNEPLLVSTSPDGQRVATLRIRHSPWTPGSDAVTHELRIRPVGTSEHKTRPVFVAEWHSHQDYRLEWKGEREAILSHAATATVKKAETSAGDVAITYQAR